MPQVGEKAPDFDLMTDDNKQVRLRDFKGKTVVLYFYPKDDTPGCTKEACAFRDGYDQLLKMGVLLGVSLDAVKAHQKFKQKYSLPFPLLADQDAVTSKAYGVYKKKSMYGRSFWGIERTTFIIGPDGKIKMIFPRVKVDGHYQEVLEALK
jgi:peroxiredoxin Q/BCP